MVCENFGVKDMDIISVCQLLRDRRPLLDNFILYKRISYTKAEDISWMVLEKPYRTWSRVSDDKYVRHVWKNQDGDLRKAVIVSAPQVTPE